MSEWGRKEYPSWPSRSPVLTWGAFFVALLFLFGGMAWQYAQEWSFAEREYLGNYMLASTMGWLRDQGHYRLLTYVDRKGGHYIAIGDEIERVKMADGQPGYRLTEAGIRAGAVRMEWQDSMFPNAWMRAKLKHAVYKDGTVWDYIEGPAYGALGILAVLLFFALPRDRKRALEFKHGRRLRGPELVTTAEFNRRFGQWRWLKRHLPDGLGIINEEQSWLERTFDHIWSRWVRIPRAVESHHMLLMGDTGSGKSAIIRQVLIQIAERGETAIVYDPALEYLPQFYDARRGDVILNPLDARCPYWTPGDEVPHPAEALTLAASLFPDQGRENRFFVESPRRIFAHLLNLKPTPEELTAWMSNPEEIDKRVRGTEMAAMIDPHAGPQRSGVLGSLGMIVDALRLLPREAETKQRWSTVAWAKERKGWIFITSKPTMRERLRPLISLWLDLLVLRLMNEGETGVRKTWFVLDELASLQRLPQLSTVITENRKSNNPLILGFQGKAQIEALYGHVSEAMLSQPATKIFLKTSEPNAAEWISKAIGNIKIERYRETRTHAQSPQVRESESQQRDIMEEPLIMASEIGGLDPLHGYLKHGNYVVRLRTSYLQLAARHEKFIARKIDPAGGGPENNGGGVARPPAPPNTTSGQQLEPKPAAQQQHFFE